ncbi:MAG: hypothetical protein AAF355_00355 [Myxococcota bacterium]
MTSSRTDSSQEIEMAPGGTENGLVSMLAELIGQNLADDPARRAVFARLLGRVAIVAEDLDLAVTLQFKLGRLVVHHGICGIPDITIRTSSEMIVRLSQIEVLTRGIPNPFGPNARDALRAVWRGELRVYGGVRNLPVLWRISRVLSVLPGSA